MLEFFMIKSVILAGVVGAISFLLTASGLITYASPVVIIEDGQLQGRISYSRNGSEYFEYLGIPFGAPPINELRFEPPVPSSPWKGIKQVTSYPPWCVQLDAMVRGRTYGQEDCLYLNVFTHSVETNDKKPTLVYIHGGGFLSGTSGMYGPKYFMDEDVVLVTINYRLGPLGFLNSGNDLIRGNMGLKDQHLALEWVQRNIDKFGGDPNQVTLFGESAGAASVGYHIISPSSRGLFHRAIAQSGYVTCPWSFNTKPTRVFLEYAKLLNCPTENTTTIVDCMRKMDAHKLVKPQMQYMDPLSGFEMIVPSVEPVVSNDSFLLENPRTSLKSGDFAPVPLMIGVTSGEGGLRTARYDAMPELIPKLDEKWDKMLPELMCFDKTSDTTAQKIRKYYFGTNTFEDDEFEFKRNFTLLNSDGLFYEPIRRAAMLHAKQGSPTYMYLYDYDSSMLPRSYSLFRAVRSDDWIFSEAKLAISVIMDWLRENVFGGDGPHQFGATHADDLFQLWNIEWVIELFSGRDYEFSRNFVKLFVDFARNEQPLQFNGVSWPPIQIAGISPESPTPPLNYMLIDREPKVVSEPFVERMHFWESLHIRD
ncbi:unnamed protein product [Orchesella dallaii]|uniref:Carboxylic ester hydrolase n=1 Tax=Orchesella dallaii TaxID=48710 RepID=A0ABP1PX29_9HEXA